jgi:hypothetical protein
MQHPARTRLPCADDLTHILPKLGRGFSDVLDSLLARTPAPLPRPEQS